MIIDEQKTDVDGFVKVNDSFLINKDLHALNEYRNKKVQAKRLNTMENDIELLKKELSEIKELLKKVLK